MEASTEQEIACPVSGRARARAKGAMVEVGSAMAGRGNEDQPESVLFVPTAPAADRSPRARAYQRSEPLPIWSPRAQAAPARSVCTRHASETAVRMRSRLPGVLGC